MEMTDWNLLYDENANIGEKVDVSNSYYSLYVENIVPLQSVE